MTNILNPKPAIFYVAAVPQFLSLQQPGFYLTGGVLGLTHAAVALLFYGSVVLLMQRLARHLLRPAVSRVVKAFSGTAFVLPGGMAAHDPGARLTVMLSNAAIAGSATSLPASAQ